MTKPDANGWYPIESVPRQEGKKIMLWHCAGRPLADCSPIGKADWWTPMGIIYAEEVSHWRYPPKPPVEFEEKGDG